MRRLTIGLWLAMAALAAGCSPLKDTKTADAEISAFHQKLNAGDFAAIYAASSADMKSAATQDKMVQLFTAVHRKLGNFESGAAVGWNDNITAGGHFLSVNYSAKYDRGAASENFYYRIDGAQAQLAGYHVSSDAFFLN